MGVFEQVFRPGNEGREKECNDLVTDIISDLKYIQNASNGIIDSCNTMLKTTVAHVEYDSKAPKQLIEDVRARYGEIERLARAKYDDLDAVDKPTLDHVINNWEGTKTPDDIEKLMAQFKNHGFASEAASIAASIAVFVVLTPILNVVLKGFVAGVLGAVVGALAGLAVAAIIDAIAAEQKYHQLEEALKDLRKTKTLLKDSRDKIVNAADDLKFSIRYAQKKAKGG